MCHRLYDEGFFFISCNDSMSLAVREKFLDLWLGNACNRTSNVFGDVNVSAQSRKFSFPPTLRVTV